MLALEGEEWVPWIRRATRKVTEKAALAGIRTWVHQHLRRKWIWAGKVVRMTQHRQDSWALNVTFWRGSQWKSDYLPGSPLHSFRPLRARPGRWRRWEDEIDNFCSQHGLGDWMVSANDVKRWKATGDDFIAWAWK